VAKRVLHLPINVDNAVFWFHVAVGLHGVPELYDSVKGMLSNQTDHAFHAHVLQSGY
jgi:hypothetical protein